MNRKTPILAAAVLLLAATPALGILVQPPPTPILGFAAAVDEGGGGAGTAVGQCDALLATCAGAAADAGGGCYQGTATIAILPDPHFKVCAAWGVAAGGGMSRFVVQSREGAQASVVSHFADNQEIRKRCEITGYVHDYVKEECEYYIVRTPVEPERDASSCHQSRQVNSSYNPVPVTVGQINTCAAVAYRVAGSVCVTADANGYGVTTGFTSEVAIGVSTCDKDASSERAEATRDTIKDAKSFTVISDVLEYLPNDDRVRPVSVLLEQALADGGPGYYEVPVSDLGDSDQELLQAMLPAAFDRHMEVLSRAFDGNPQLRALGDALLADMERQFDEALASPDLTVLVFPDPQE